MLFVLSFLLLRRDARGFKAKCEAGDPEELEVMTRVLADSLWIILEDFIGSSTVFIQV